MDRETSARLTFAAGGGETGAVLRTGNWRESPLGPIDTWPPILRAVVATLLSCPQPMVIAWGQARTALFNDPYLPLAGSHGAAGLGQPVAELFATSWEAIAPAVAAAARGEGANVPDVPMVLNRDGASEESWWTFAFMPIRDDAGQVVGVMAVATDTTAHLLSARRHGFQLAMEDALRGLADPRQIMETTVTLLGRHLKANRVGYGEVQDDGDTVVVGSCYADGVAPINESFRLSTMIRGDVEARRRGQTVVHDDIARDPHARVAVFAALATRAFVSVPLVRDGRLRATLYASFREPHRWRAEDVGLVEYVAARTWDALERARAEATLRASETQLRDITDALPVLVSFIDNDRRYRFVNQAYTEWFGRARNDVLGREMGEVLGPAAYANLKPHVDAALSGQTVRFETLAPYKDGGARYIDAAYIPRRGPDGTVEGFYVLVGDITARTKAEQHLRLLVDELNHRVKNTLAIVQGLAQQTFREEAIPVHLRQAYEGRLAALAAAHNLLTQENWESADLRDLVTAATAAVGSGEGRMTLTGPPVRLPPKSAITIAIALHELTTNAVKYGALSTATGRIVVAWRCDAPVDGVDRRLRLRWQESDGPAVAPPERRGFGSRMIERALAAELDGSVRLEFKPEGLVCEIDAPLPRHGSGLDAARQESTIGSVDSDP